MGRILKFIEEKGEGKYLCYKTNKITIESSEADVLDYDDKPASTRNTSLIAESNLTRVHTVRVPQMLIDYSRPIFTYFLDGSRHVYKVDDIAIGKKIFPVLAGQIVVGCCENLLGKNPSQQLVDLYSNEKQVTKQTPPAFIMHSANDDIVPLRNSLEYCQALTDKGVSAVMHIYPDGGHGWCYHEWFVWKDLYKAELAEWLRRIER